MTITIKYISSFKIVVFFYFLIFYTNIRSDWYQNNTRVFLDIFAKNLSTNQVTVHFFPQAVLKKATIQKY